MNSEHQQQSQTEQDVQRMIEEAGYPDISKTNTKTVVLWSLIVIVLVFLLSVFFPDLTNPQAPTTDQVPATTQVRTQS